MHVVMTVGSEINFLWVESFLPLSLLGDISLRKSFNLNKFVSTCVKRQNNGAYLTSLLWRLGELQHIKFLTQSLALTKSSMCWLYINLDIICLYCLYYCPLKSIRHFTTSFSLSNVFCKCQSYDYHYIKCYRQ